MADSDSSNESKASTTLSKVEVIQMNPVKLTVKILQVLIWKTILTMRRRWPVVVGIYFGVLILFTGWCMVFRTAYPFKLSDVGASVDVELEIGPDWVLSCSHPPNEGVVLIGYAPGFPLIQALMEEAERILARNGFPQGIKEYQVVPFKSEYSMAKFIRDRPGILQYAYAFSIPHKTYPTLSPVLNIISYIHDKNNCYHDQYPACPGDAYIAKVIMEAFMNAHSRKENNVTLKYRRIKEHFKRRDPIFNHWPVIAINVMYTGILAFLTWVSVYVLAAERETIQLALKGMGVSLGLNYTANLIVLDLFLLAILVSFAFAFSTPFFGNVPIVYSSDPVVRMVFMICYVGSFSSYCCLGSVLFHKAATCVMFTCFLFIISVYLDMNWNPPPFLDRALLIFSVAGTQKGITALINLEKTVDGIHWSNINLELTTEDNHIICVMREMRILLISIPLQLIAAALVVLFSSRLKTAEIRFRKRLWGRRSVIGQVEQNMAHYEAHHEEGEACAVFEHLHTDGADGRATLRDINWTIQKGEVSIALGLENSGRLAILAVIYGDTTPIYGTASVFGLDLMKHPTKIIRDCGVSNRGATGLFMNLTVRDNFRVFSKIRHCCQQRVRHNRDSLINDAGLKSLLDTQVWKLREEDRVALKVALAFLGDSLLVILEDPTKDQEIHTKMRLWNLIKNHSKGRTVLISTMCMTEAQMIGDRITIFMDGQIHCSGSVRYIKSFFGTGYYLDIVKKRRADSKNISLICREYCPDCVLVEETNKRSMFLLPCTSDMGNVEDLLDFLEANQAKLQIASYDLQGSRLENAFVNLTTACMKSDACCADKRSEDSFQASTVFSQSEAPSRAFRFVAAPSTHISTSSFGLADSSTTEFQGPPLDRRVGVMLFVSRLGMLLMTRLLGYSRRMDIEFLQAFAIILLVLYYEEHEHSGWYFGEKTVDHRYMPDNFCPSLMILAMTGGREALAASPASQRLWDTLLQSHDAETISECSKVAECMSESGNDETNMTECIQQLSMYHGLSAYGIQLDPTPQNPMKALIFSSRRIPGKSLIPAMTASMEAFLRFANNDTEGRFKIHFSSVFEPPRFRESHLDSKLAIIAIIIFTHIAYHSINRQLKGRALSDRISGATPLTFWASYFVVDMVNYISLAMVFFLVYQYKKPMYPKGDQAEYLVAIVLLYGAVMINLIYVLQRFFHNIMFGTATAMLVIYISALPVNYSELLDDDKEQSEYSVHLNPLALIMPGYFLPSYMFHFSHNYHVETYCPHHNNNECTKDDDTHQCCSPALQKSEADPVLFVLAGVLHLIFWTFMNMVLDYHVYSYIYRWAAFKLSSYSGNAQGLNESSSKLSSTFLTKPFIQLSKSTSQMVHMGSMFGGNRIEMQNYADLNPASASSSKAFRPSLLTPKYGDPSKLASMPRRDDARNTTGRESSVDPFFTKKTQWEEAKSATFVEDGSPIPGGKDGRDERPKLKSRFRESEMTVEGSSYLFLYKLKRSPLLQDVSVTVVMGEVFCFVSSDLEVSSEVLRCIAGKNTLDDGAILFNGKPFGFQNPMNGATIGYCTKEERFGHRLTPREILSLYCTLRGVVNVREEVKTILEVFKLKDSSDIEPQYLSEGALARFRVAKAVVGEPDVILLDQPTANLDSVGKLIVSKAIRRMKDRGKMVIMTSHSIDECADLASRVAIIVRGKVMFVSSPNGIRSRFSNSYSLTVRLDACESRQVSMLVPVLTQRFPNSEIFVDSLNYLHVLLPFRTDSLADIFRLMTSMKKHLKLTNFILRHTTLDTVIDALETDVLKKFDAEETYAEERKDSATSAASEGLPLTVT